MWQIEEQQVGRGWVHRAWTRTPDKYLKRPGTWRATLLPGASKSLNPSAGTPKSGRHREVRISRNARRPTGKFTDGDRAGVPAAALARAVDAAPSGEMPGLEGWRYEVRPGAGLYAVGPVEGRTPAGEPVAGTAEYRLLLVRRPAGRSVFICECGAQRKTLFPALGHRLLCRRCSGMKYASQYDALSRALRRFDDR